MAGKTVQPVAALSGEKLRCFSITLPYHGPEGDSASAIQNWAKELQNGNNLIYDFVCTVKTCIDTLVEEGLVDEEKIAAGGLSRGGFVASQLASLDSRLKNLVLYAPLCDMHYNYDFKEDLDEAILKHLSLKNLSSELYDRSFNILIGNRDVRVGTRCAFDFLEALTETAFQNKIRSPDITMSVPRSIGHKGHGTPPGIFYDGVSWIAERLLGEPLPPFRTLTNLAT